LFKFDVRLTNQRNGILRALTFISSINMHGCLQLVCYVPNMSVDVLFPAFLGRLAGNYYLNDYGAEHLLVHTLWW
jgi:hypothetical protein